MAKFRRKGTFKKILAGALAVVLGVGAIAGVSSLVGNKADDDGKVAVNPKWSIGGLDENGKYEESDATLYTKDAFECQGLTIKPNFDSNVKYQIFFYDEMGEFIESTSVLENAYNSDIPNGSTHARLEVTPVWGDDVEEDDQIIKWYNKHKWENNLEIKVDEKQLSFVDQLEQGDDVYTLLGQGMFDVETDEFSSNTTSPWYFSGVIDCSSVDEIIIKIETTELSRKVNYSGKERYAINMYDLTNDVTLPYDGNPTVVAVKGKFSYVSVDCSNFDSFVFSTSPNVVDTLKVYLV